MQSMAACRESAVLAAMPRNAFRFDDAERAACGRCGVRVAVHFAAGAGIAAFAEHVLPSPSQ